MRRRLLLLPLLALIPATAGDGAVPIAMVTLAAALPTCGGDDAAPVTVDLMPGYGDGGFPVQTASRQAQAFFDNGMQLAHAFSHKAATAAFAESVRLDPTCAMCAWGLAWSQGPTINYPVPDAEVAVAERGALKAESLLKADAPQRDRDLIAALKLRYVNGGGAKPGDRAFADAMDALATKYPADDEIATMTADAWMIATPSSSDTLEHGARATDLLEATLKRHPDYTPAIHFYIHVTEAMGYPARAERYADKLPALAPKASHLIHMPSHTYYWIGRYQDAVDANVQAAALGVENAKRLGLPQPGGEWLLPYHAHNVTYGIGGAMLSGDVKDALALSGAMLKGAATLPKDKPLPVYAQGALGLAYAAQARYADPQAMLALPAPKADARFALAFWHYGRGETYARAGDAAGIKAELAAVPTHFGDLNTKDRSAGAAKLVALSRWTLVGRLAMLQGKPKDAAKAFRKAADILDEKGVAGITDPPLFWYPVRRSYAQALLAMGQPAAALAQTDLVLKRYKAEPLTLQIRAQAEAALGQKAQAAEDQAAAAVGWHGPLALTDAKLI